MNDINTTINPQTPSPKSSLNQENKIPNLKSGSISPEKFLDIEQDPSFLQLKTEPQFNDYEICLHPTSLHDKVEQQHQQQQQQTEEGYLNTTNSNVENILEDNLYERKSSFGRRPSQLSQDLAALNALCPPSHVLKARRLSKNTIKTSVSTPIISSSKPRSRKPSIVDSYSKEFSNNSAVSPRFMALRKLSEVTTLPSHSLSFSAVPPVPQIPSTYQSPAEKDDKNEELESRVLSRLDDIIETQLQFHLGQIVWRASESHLDARRFWEDQKKEMFSFAATVVDRMEAQLDIQKRMALETIPSPTDTKKSDEDTDTMIVMLQKELSMYKSKYTDAQRKLFELEVIKTRNQELEKQHEMDMVALKTLSQEKEAVAKQLKELQDRHLNQANSKTNKRETIDRTKLYNLETQNKQLKSQVKQMQEINQQLLEEATTHETKIKAQNKEIKKIKSQLVEAELVILNNKRKMAPTTSTSTVADGIDCSEDFGKKQQKTKKMDNWADMMQSEDEAKKTSEEWALKYKELQAKYYEVCLKLDNITEDEQKVRDLTELLNAKDQEIRHLKQAESVNRIQIDYLQLELDKSQKKSSAEMKQKARRSQPPRTRPITPVNNSNNSNNNNNSNSNSNHTTTKPNTNNKSTTEPSYITEDGYLTFTTEINGKPSRYSIKIPQGYQQETPKKKLNPNASTWKNNTK
ncbi:uncharacterized protein B0P05DRAFT_595342 [Gilbertella persicaria]|uniref:uncharacterized protein n=1 Tax=Gilbertella persicaria TaxID=101096 RepID=UPI00221F3E41|nr:uncharacterized protein B0P05DRAFT_595342 [Gilbertella persicaria]KAI8085891.1 hypothetical protein B0P05DRAFT_595342 [Gilbertella persicaria]